MPKRIPTPEPGDDEPKYYTVVQPYPLNANWELPHDYITCGRWVASCLGSPQPFFALFYKPSARGQILLEINRDYACPEKLLGEHRWSEFLRGPTEEEAGRVTQIFYSTYSHGRAAQKDGWKRINVADSWFKNWSSENPVMAYPYPPTKWCPLPPEDKTNKPMCRPLPVSLKPPPQASAPPPPPIGTLLALSLLPGSAAWHDKKTAPTPNSPAILRGAWAAKQIAIQKTAKNIPSTSTAPWHKPTAPKAIDVVAQPPGLEMPTLSSSSTSTASSHSSENQYDVVVTEMATISMSPSQEARLYNEASPVVVEAHEYIAEWEKTALVTTWTSKATPLVATPEEEENLWGEEDDIEQKKKQTQEILCTVHGIICKKGICQEYSRLLKQKEREERSKKASSNNRTNNNNKGSWKKHAWDDDSASTGSESQSRSTSNDGWSTVRSRR
ncbi:hypothetical protein MIND_00709300 [Mycena indigotica]|uniref:Uncharacterized protein n=1 Tax=Mycena indigotica TaxID=2126181 RepID=A0A8H6SM96_9AGAR|nr:uncharacterized protein MIND_00709300 [Mycena indigotica]KAF7301440.1 hypothetical protein MIND_00709300 [Mycena indigotica]